MRTWFIIALTLIPSRALCHPVDMPCEVGQLSEDGCQPLNPWLGLDNPDFYEAHRVYWHCLRELVVDYTVSVAELYGKVKQRREDLNVPPMFPHVHPEEFLTYWNIIPAHPELDFPGEAWRPQALTRACEGTAFNAEYIRYYLQYELDRLNEQFAEKQKPVAPPAPVTYCCDKKKKKCKLC